MASQTVNTTHVNFTVGGTLLLCILTIMVCGALLISRPTGTIAYPIGPHGNIRDMTAKEAEEAYGPVDVSAGSETKQGIFFNRRTQRTYSRNVSWNRPARVAYTQRYASSCQPCSPASVTYSNPTPANPQDCSQAPSPKKLTTPSVSADVPIITPPGQLRIIPSL